MSQPDWLAKDALDVGLFTNQLDAQLAFWQGEVGLAFDHMLPVGGGVRQHRHDHDGGVLKLNHSREPLLPASRGGYQRLIIATDRVTVPRDLTDPDGNAVRLVPPGHDGIGHWAIDIATTSKAEFYDHYETALGLPRAPGHPIGVLCGRSVITGTVMPDAAPLTDSADMRRVGFRYTTLQVWKVDETHANVIARGGAEGTASATLGKTARISFIKDRCGNWMELSQRASITGSLSA